jgi:hypothetical protein
MNIKPIFDLAIDSSKKNDVTDIDPIISRMAPHLSVFEARLKKSHQITTARPPSSPARIPAIIAFGSITGRIKRSIHWSRTMMIPALIRREDLIAGTPAA